MNIILILECVYDDATLTIRLRDLEKGLTETLMEIQVHTLKPIFGQRGGTQPMTIPAICAFKPQFWRNVEN